MLIVHVTNTDPAGCVFNFVRAMNQHTPHRVRLIATQTLPAFDFPKDIHDLYDGGDEIKALLTQADVIHFHKVTEDFHFEFEMQRGLLRFDMKDYVKGKKIVYHVHGAPHERNFVEDSAAKFAHRPDAFLLTSTPDLEEMYKPYRERVKYWPNLVPIHDVRYLPRATDEPIMGSDGESKRYCVFQSGTHSILKNMHVIREVMDRVAKDLPAFFLHTSPDSIQTQDSALRHKRIAHIVFDHIEGYYGLSSLEGLSMGKPVIAGLSDYTRNAIASFFGISTADLPWVLAHNEAGIEREIRELIGNTDYRRHFGAKSREFMESVWSDKAVAEKMAEFYESL